MKKLKDMTDVELTSHLKKVAGQLNDAFKEAAEKKLEVVVSVIDYCLNNAPNNVKVEITVKKEL